jgi:hypothetical protein
VNRRGRVLLALWVGAVVIVSVQAAAHHNNNFEIFRTSWLNLLSGNDLYADSPRHFDKFLYSPTFAVLFAPFAVLPFWLGVLLWNAANAATLYWGLGRVLPEEGAFAARVIVFMDTVGSMQNAQSNALVAGLMIITFADLERRRELRAALAVAIGTAIKIFPLVAAVFSIFRPWRVPRFALYGLIAGTLLLGAPLLFMSPAALMQQYRSWMNLQSGHDGGYSIMHHLQMWLGIHWANWPVQLMGIIVLLAPLLQVPHWGDLRFRLLFLASTLMFCVLFNHAAESPSFVIAVAGVAIWFTVSPRNRVSWTVLTIVIVGTVLSASDAMPAVLRQHVFVPYKLKTIPVVLVWGLTQFELWRRNVSVPFRAPVPERATPVR